jgi:asparagine N-glycosylation enzyme membrane subunit Stt3
MMATYMVPAATLIGSMLMATRFLRKPPILAFEYFTWLLPGITYWFMFAPLGLEQALRGKSLSNLVEPVVVAILAAVLFLVRLIHGARRPTRNRAAACWCVALSNLAAVVVFVATPGLPE